MKTRNEAATVKAERDALKDLLLAAQRAAIECAEERDRARESDAAQLKRTVAMQVERDALLAALEEMKAIADVLANAGQHLFPAETAERVRAAIALAKGGGQ